MDITQAIEQLVPQADYGGYPRGRATYEDPERFRWRDKRPKPPWAEIEPLLDQPAPEPDRPLTAEELKEMLETAAAAGKPGDIRGLERPARRKA